MPQIVRVEVQGETAFAREALRKVQARIGPEHCVVWVLSESCAEIELQHVEKRVDAIAQVRRAVSETGGGSAISGGDLDIFPLGGKPPAFESSSPLDGL